jgi:hypothetical protein
MAIDFLLGELRHAGVLGPAMALLPHYFTPFQAFVIQESENERLRFDLRCGSGWKSFARKLSIVQESLRRRASSCISSRPSAVIG